MSDTVQAAPAEPVAQAQTPAEKNGASNTGMSDFARKLAAKQTPPAAFAKAVETVKEQAQAAPQTEEAKAPIAEVTAEEPKETEVETPESEDAETETEEVLSPETPTLDSKLKEKINRRIGKEVAKRKELEAKILRLESMVSEPKEVEKEVEVPVSANVPLAHITSLSALNDYRDALQNDIIEAEMLLHTEFPATGLETKWGTMTKPQLIAALTQAKKDERMAIPAREKFLNTRVQSTQAAHEKFPFLADPSHPGYQMAKTALRENPILRSYPNTEYLVGLIVQGQLVATEQEEPKAKQAVKPKAVPTKGQAEITSDASITRAPTGILSQQALQQERAKVTGGKKSLGHKDFAQLLLANQRHRNSL